MTEPVLRSSTTIRSIRRSMLYVNDMDAIADFLTETNRIQDRKDVLSNTYTEPLKMVDPALVEVEGQWKP